MATYFEIYNDDGTHFIDDNFRNFEIVQRGFITATNDGTMLPYPGSPDLANLVFVRPIGGTGYFRNYGPPPGGLPAQVGIYPPGTYFAVFNQFPNRQFEYIVARSGGVPGPNDNFGLQVFNEAGEEVFHSSRKYLTLVDSWLQPVVTSPTPTTRQLPAPATGKDLFVCINFMPVTRVTSTNVEGSLDLFSEAWAVQLSGQTLTIVSFFLLDGETGQQLSWQVPNSASQMFLIAEA